MIALYLVPSIYRLAGEGIYVSLRQETRRNPLMKIIQVESVVMA
jgi:hypothetical protein